MVDIARDARWGRISESPGEDPYLASVYSRAKVRGFQGDDPKDPERISSCLKHFVAYGAVESGQDYNTVSMAKSMLHNGYLPLVKAAVEEGAMTVMAAFNDYNGVPCTVNSYLLRDVLKKAYGFDGFVVSDASAVRECVTHWIASDLADASQKALTAGLDMDMGSDAYHSYLEAQAESGQVPMEVLDEAVYRVLSVKMALGLFDHPYVSEERMTLYDEVLPEEHLDVALDAAKRSMVLLKNENVLPLKKNQKILLVGELADSGDDCMGALLAAAVETGKPVAAVLMNGRPLALAWEAEHVPAILEAWQLGTAMGDAVAAVLFGDYNPSGKLCCMFPAVTGQCPRYYNHPNTGRPGGRSKFTSRYLDAPADPLYPFGYGLSYTVFEYKDMQVEETADTLIVSVAVANVGAYVGEETVQLYMRDVTASLVRPVKELKNFSKVFLKPGEEERVTLSLSKSLFCMSAEIPGIAWSSRWISAFDTSFVKIFDFNII